MKKMTKKDLKEFKKLVIRKKEEVLDTIQHISNDTLKRSPKDATGDISGYSIHLADMATDNYDREFSLGLATNEQKIIFEVDDALKRIEEGTYGVCGDCEKLITKTRLKAIPYTKLCVKCQEKHEKKV